MAGVGIETNRVYPTHSRARDTPAMSHDQGGGAFSRNRLAHDQDYITKVQTSLTLEEVRYSEMRKKIPGMGRIPKTRLNPQDEDWEKDGTWMRTQMTGYNTYLHKTGGEIMCYERAKDEHVVFIKQHFKQLECVRFVPAKKGQTAKCRAELKCECGEVLIEHSGMKGPTNLSIGDQYIVESFIVPDELKPYIGKDKGNLPVPEKLPDVSWSKDTALRTQTTASFGKINFVNVESMGGKKPAKYIRLSANDSVDHLIELMEKHWRINEPTKPNLVISVVGGAKNFRLDGRMRETFSSGLIKAAKTTNAWLITSGFNMGVMKAVGMAVSEGQSFTWNNDRMSHVLRCIAFAPWGYVSKRKCLESSEGQGCFNADYKTSNVILHGQPVPLNANHTHFIFVDDGFRNRYGGVAAFRAKFESRVQEPKEVGGLGVPVVLVVVEGGTDAIDDAKNSLERNIPVVICASTGRAADILTYAYSHSQAGKPTKPEKLKAKIFKAYGEKWKEEEIEQKTDDILQKVLACIAKKELMIIFYMNQHGEMDIAILSVLLKAKSQEATDTQRLDQLQLALTWDRVDIAQEQIFREDVTWGAGSLDNVLFTAILTDKVEFVQLILQQGVVMKEFLTKERLAELYVKALESKQAENIHFQKILRRMTSYKTNFDLSHISELIVKLMDKYQENFEKPKFNNLDKKEYCKRPYKELMIWSILLLRHNMAKFAWEMGGEPVTSAIAASRLYGSLAHFIHRNEALLREKVHSYKDEFEKLAVNVLDECHSKDHEKAMMLVERQSPTWSNMSSMEIAASANDQAYLASVACQNSISITWKRGIVSHWHRVFSAMFFPFLIVTPFLEISKFGEQTMGAKYKIMTFYTSPITKFAYHMLMYTVFLVLFTYMLLVDFHTDYITVLECILIAWIFTFMVDDIYTMITFPSPTIYGKFRDWYGLLKWLDLCNFILAFIAFFLHFNKDYFMTTKVLYCINCIIFYIRIMKAYTSNSSLGPKLVMIKRMMHELGMFFSVLVVFLLAYGISSQALMYKQRHSSWNILRNVVYYPYWQLFGEIFLEELDTDADCLSMAGNSTDSASYCRQSHWLVPFLLAGYLMVGNVLLLNLLIAIFSHVFDTIELNSIEIWKYHMYFLTMEFDNKTALVPPFSIITHCYLVLKWIFRKTCCRKTTKGVQFMPRHLEYLQVFEKEEMTNYLRKKKAEEKSTLETKINKLQKRNDELFQLLEEEIWADVHAGMADTIMVEPAMKQTTVVPTENTLQINDKPSVYNKQKVDIILDNDSVKKEKKEKKKRKKEKKEKKKKKELENTEKILNNIDAPPSRPANILFNVNDHVDSAVTIGQRDSLSAGNADLPPRPQSPLMQFVSQERSRVDLDESDSDYLPPRRSVARHFSGLNVPPNKMHLRRTLSRTVSSDSDEDNENGIVHSPRGSALFRGSSTEDERKRHRLKKKRYKKRSMVSDTD